jgi:hypothetical protein
MQLKVDHVTMCGSNLDIMRRSLAAAGLPSDYGGPHANRATHMALVGFEDGSYLELIAPLAPEAAASGMMASWANFMRDDAGPSAWAVASADIHADVERLSAAGIPALGPDSGGRTRADGTALQWEIATLGTGPAGSLLPFMIQDKTSRALRVQPSAALKGSAISGVAAVVLGVRDLEEAAAQFRKAYGWAEPLAEEYPEMDVSLAHFPGTPVILAAAQSTQENWLHSRVERFGECPAAFLLSTPNLVNAVRRFPLQPEGSWFRRRLAWFDPAELGAMRLGVIECATDSSMP